MALEIIGAGFGRTGTESMKRALELLGYDPCYHMYEVLPHWNRVDLWRRIAQGARADWDEVFDGYRATVDWPACMFWRELAAHYPNARILLTVRSAESWYASMKKTIIKVMEEEGEGDTSVSQVLIRNRCFEGNIHDGTHMMDTFERHNAEVEAAFGSDRLLVYELGSEWQPLCEFLQLPVPQQAFPSGNRAEEFHSRVSTSVRQRAATEKNKAQH